MTIGVSRFLLPENYFDVTSPKLLVQPEPQYLFALLIKAALGISLSAPSELGVAGRGIASVGAAYANLNDARLKLASDLPAEIVAVKHDFNGAPGHTVRFNRPQYADTTYTQASRRISTGSAISVVPIGFSSEQVPLTLERYGGPYDQANSRVAPIAIEEFDAQLGVHSLSDATGKQLGRDFDKTLDSFGVALFDAAVTATSNIVYPQNVSADNDMTAKGDYPFTYEMMSRTSRKMDEANLPVLADGRRCMVVRPSGKEQLKLDPAFRQNSEFHKEMNVLFPSYFKSTPEFHLFVSNTLTRTANSSSVNVEKALAIAPQCFGLGLGKNPPRVASATDDNYGTQAKVIWLADLALGILDNRFVYHVRHAESAG